MFLNIQQSLISTKSVNRTYFRSRKCDQKLLDWAVNDEIRLALPLDEHKNI